ncbi:TonB-dependent receptor [Erythrobacter sp. F6033]|uniref:TonB-dependent receptor plug domain-containing protein n=1 Tax=Erythrobacter sp. F6033 TaxID=2926401 RepID=UPI001FF4F818|nr:TonB-dependent receptor [Erythrobacter sp. F6033]MCK0129255.1 hypothetical protein [Erythrobacter sp. F6033]
MNSLKARIARTLSHIAIASCVACSPAYAQDEAGSATTDPVVYDEAYFAPFAPRTSLDMVRQVPGFAIVLADDRRGLGQGGANVLIDGERIPGKAEDALDALSRIAAADVARIEVIDGTTLGISGLVGQVVNVIRRRSGISGSFGYEASVGTDDAPPQFGKANLAVNGGTDRLSWSVALAHDQVRSRLFGQEVVRGPAGNLLDSRIDEQFFIGDQPTLSGSIKRTGPGGDILNLSAELQLLSFEFSENSERFGSDGLQTAPDRTRNLIRDEGRTKYEIGGDYAFDLGEGRFKLIGLHTSDDTFRAPAVVTSFSDVSPVAGTEFRRDARAIESIARAEYAWSAGQSNWEISVEGALNSLDVENALAVRDANGALQNIDFPDSSVKEERAEAIINYARPLSPNLSLQAALGGEYSQIQQSGAADLTRSFIRPKGSLALAWRASPNLDVSTSLEREVGQLNFFDFIASVDPNNGDDVGTNPNLRPPQSWVLDVEATRALGKAGNITLRAYREWISDIVDQVPIGADGEAPGNIDTASRYGLEWTSTILGDAVGIPGARLNTTLALERSRVIDPLTGARREITRNRQRRLKIDFRHDIPRSDIAWGASWQNDRDAAIVRLDSVFRETRTPGHAELFVEHKNFMGLTVRAAAVNVLDDKRAGERRVFNGRRTDPLAFSESRMLGEGLIFRLRIEGSF